MSNITLIGMPGSGKSTVGKLLARKLDFDFLDVDLLIEEREDKALIELIDTLGVDGFLDVEEKAVCTISCDNYILSPGGSVVCRESAINHFKNLGAVIYLHVPLAELTERVKNLSTRGIAMEAHETLADVMAKRAPLYKKYADYIIDCPSDQSAGQTVDKIMELYNKLNHK